jgi:hypothetical protein
VDGRLQSEGHQGEEMSSLSADITHSNAEAAVVEAKEVNPFALYNELKANADLGEEQSIKSFLSRPQILSYGNLAATGAWPTLVYSGMFPYAFINSSNLISRKLDGVWATRMKLIFTVAVNAQRFQQGRYVLAWVPSGGGNGLSINMVSHYASRTQLTQLPHVELDLACDTEVTLEVPFVSALSFAPVSPTVSTYSQVGQIIFAPYSAIKAGPSSYNCDYVLSVRAEDIELHIPVSPQNKGRAKGFVKRRVEDAEKDSAGIGPISSKFKMATSVLDKLSKVPVLSSVAGPASWATEIAGNVATAFGWSKPHNSEPNRIMLKNNFGAMTNTDTADNSEVMGYSDKNAIEVLPGFAGTNIDEMSIPYIIGISSFYQSVTWNATDPENTVLHQRDLHPKNFFSQSSYGANTLFNLTPMAFVASMFGLYRGSIKISMKVVKTEFHSGRLLLTYSPADSLSSGSAVPSDFLASGYNFREIVDIREGSVFHFVIPYTSFAQYKQTTGSNIKYGTFTVKVLNELRAPDTVASSVDILFEASAHSDMEFAMPATIRGSPCFVATAQMGAKPVQFADDLCESEAVVMGNARIMESDLPSRVCIGEKIVSLRQVLKKFSLLDKRTAGTPNTYYQIVPFAFPISRIGAANALVNSTVRADNLTFIACCYALFRGGVRYKIMNSAPITDGRFFMANSYLYSPDAGSLDTTLNFVATPTGINAIGETSNNSVVIERQESRGGLELQFPFYSRTHACAVSDAIINETSAVQVYNPSGIVPPTLAYIANFGAALTADYRTYRAVADDFDLGMFISVPPIVGWGFTGGV